MDAQRQQPLDFESRDRERGVLLGTLDEALGTGRTACLVRFLVELCYRIGNDGCLAGWRLTGPPGDKRALAKRMNLGESTTRYVVRVAVACGVLRKTRTTRPDGSNGRLVLTIDWEAIAARRIVPAEIAARTVNGCRSDRQRLTDGPATVDGPTVNGCRAYTTNNQSQPPTRAPTKSQPPALASAARGWEGVEADLRATGLGTAAATVALAQERGLTPEAVLEALQTYAANRQLFRGPGAIRHWVVTGTWPAEGIVSPAQAAARTSRTAARRHQTDADGLTYQFVTAGRRAGLTDAQIREQLAGAGIAWE